MIDQHKQFEDNIEKFFKNELTGNSIRRFVYHYNDCKTCQELAKEEYAFYSTYNDLDKTTSFNYRKDLDEKVSNMIKGIEHKDKVVFIRYFILSLLICVGFIVALGFILRIIYL